MLVNSLSMPHLVSIIMPAYNAERHIAQSVESVLEQTYPGWELIVVDDGSGDRTGEIARAYSAKDGRIKYVFQQNGRLGKARNTGIKNATGQMIAFLDSDDLWVKEKLRLQVETVEETKADLVFSDGYIFFEDEVEDESQTFPTIYGRFEGTRLFDLLLIQNRIPVLSVMARKDVLHQVGLFEERRAYHGSEDYDLWLKLARHGAVFYGMQEKLVRYRRHLSAMTHLDSELLKPSLAVVKKHINDSGLSGEERRQKLRSLYRELISALVEEHKEGEAKEYMREFSAWDKAAFTTQIQRALLKVFPSKYNYISRECLYRTEWHMSNLRGKLRMP